MDHRVIRNIAIFAIIVLAFFFGRVSAPPKTIVDTKVEYDTLTIVKTKPDTMWRDRVVYKYLHKVEDADTTKSVDTIRIVDTVLVAVPINTYKWDTESYSLEVEGFDVKLKHLDIYTRTEYRVEKVKSKNRWGLGIQAGYGVSKQGLTPYIGVGVSYNIIMW